MSEEMVDVGEALLQPLHEVPKFGGGEVLDQLPVDHRVGDELVEAPQHAGQVFDIDHVEADVVVATAVVEVGWGPQFMVLPPPCSWWRVRASPW